MKHGRIIVVSMVVVLSTRMAARSAPPEAPQFPRDRPVDIRHIRLEMKVDLEKKLVQADALLEAVTLREVQSIKLDAVDFDVSGVMFALSEDELKDCKHENDGKHITIMPGTKLPAGQRFRVMIRYRIRDPQSGLSFFSPKDDPDAPYLMWSQGQSITNRYWVPCLDHPNEMQTTEILCTVARPYMAISNGRLAQTKENADGTRTFHWLQDKPHVAYLMTLVVGEFEKRVETWRGRPIEYYARPKYADRLERTFKNTTRMLDFFSEKIGVEYPWDKYAQVCCYGFGGGMENISSTTMREMMLRDERSMLDDDEDGLIAHEMAHQWWGDLLTCKDWAHLWLNEGFASYFEALWDEKNLDVDEFAYNMREKSRRAIEGGKDRPVVDRRYKDPDEQFDSRAYPKGAWVLHMIRRRLGDDLFWRVIQTYCEKHKHQTVDTGDLRRVIEDVTGRAFQRFFYDWTERPGSPVVAVKYEWLEEDKLASIRVEQKQEGEPFFFPLRIEFCFADGPPPVSIQREIETKDQRILYHLEKRPDYIRIDPENSVLMTLEPDLPRDMVVHQLEKDANVVGRIRAVESLASSKSSADLELLAKRLTEEKFWGVQAAIAKALGEAGGDESDRGRRANARDALLAGLKIENTKARRAVVEALGGFEDEPGVRDALRAIVEQGDPSYRVEAEAIEAWAGQEPEDGVEVLRPLLDRESNWDVLRQAVLRGIGKVGGDEAVDILAEWAAPDRPATSRTAALEGLGTLIGEDDKLDEMSVELGMEPITKALESKHRRVQFAALSAAEKLGPKAKPILKRVEKLARTGGTRLKALARRVADKIRKPAVGEGKSEELAESIDLLREEIEELKGRLDRYEAGTSTTRPSD